MKKLFSAFRYAFNGIRYALKNERNFRLEFCFTIAVCCLGLVFDISKPEWFVVVINIGAVLSAELFNTAVERLCDLRITEIHPAVKIIKDLSAAAVLITALSAAVCGAIIFIPYVLQFIKSLI